MKSSRPASLDAAWTVTTIHRCITFAASRRQTGLVTKHRFEETINGRGYKIEVLAVRPDRWRAYLVRLTDGPTALMPFYGRTPDEAARHLADWLAQAHATANERN